MDLVDRLLAHDTWTTRQLLEACRSLPDTQLDREFDIDHKSLRQTFLHLIDNMETWTDLLCERPVQDREGTSISQLIERLTVVSKDLANLTHRIVRENRFDDCYVDTLDKPPKPKTFGGTIGHLLTHSMHHRAHIMWIMERVGLKDHIEGDLLSWEMKSLGWE